MSRRYPRITGWNADALMDRAYRQLYGLLFAYVRRWYGPRCPDHDPDCVCCQAWQVVQDFHKLKPDLEVMK